MACGLKSRTIYPYCARHTTGQLRVVLPPREATRIPLLPIPRAAVPLPLILVLLPHLAQPNNPLARVRQAPSPT